MARAAATRRQAWRPTGAQAPDDEPPTCIWRASTGSTRRATSSTRSRMSRGPGARAATTSSTGRAATGAGSAAAPIRPWRACAGTTSRHRPTTSTRRCRRGRGGGRQRTLAGAERGRGSAVHRAAALGRESTAGNFLARFGVDPWSRYGEALAPYRREGQVWRTGGRLWSDPERHAYRERDPRRVRVTGTAAAHPDSRFAT